MFASVLSTNSGGTTVPVLDLARQCHQAGRLEEAEAYYRQALARDPDDPAVQHMLALVLMQRGGCANAVPLLLAAVAGRQRRLVGSGVIDAGLAAAERPQVAAIYSDLGCAFRGLGLIEEALGATGHALALAPTYTVAMSNQADLLAARGENAEAIRLLERLGRLQPLAAEPLIKLGQVCLATDDLDRAELCVTRALERDSDHPAGHRLAGDIFRRRAVPAKAVFHYRQALSRRPDDLDLLFVLGGVLEAQGDLDGAGACFQRALAIDATVPELHNALGVLAWKRGVFGEALEHYRRAMALRPDASDFANNLAGLHLSLGQYELAEQWFQKAIAVRPDSPEANNNLAMVLLKAGRLHEGFRRYEWRWQVASWPWKMPSLQQPQWRGEELAGRTLLVHCEQGYGDSVQFIRFVGHVCGAGGRVVLCCQPALKRLFQCCMVDGGRGSAGPGAVVAHDEPLPPFDFHVPLMTLPAILGIERDRLPAVGFPYLRPEDGLLAEWRQRLGPKDQRLRIGIVWATPLRSPADHDRMSKSIAPELLRPLLEVEGTHFYSLQVGPVAPWPDPRLDSDAIAAAADFADTAALIAELDLVISIDTATAHLAGALGRPVWVLLRNDASWHWLDEATTSAWYPGARLFRQPLQPEQPRNWRPVVAAVRAALIQMVKERA